MNRIGFLLVTSALILVQTQPQNNQQALTHPKVEVPNLVVEVAKSDEAEPADASSEQTRTNRPLNDRKDWSHSSNSRGAASGDETSYSDQDSFNSYGSHEGSGSHSNKNKRREFDYNL